MAVNPQTSSRTMPRRSSTATFVAPAVSKAPKTAPVKPARKSVAKKPVEVAKENSFVTGDLFDFNGTVGESPMPRGPLTRSRRSSMYVAPLRNGLVTSTVRKSVTKKSKTSTLASVTETPTAEESYVQTEPKTASKVESPDGEVSFKMEIYTPQMIEQQTRILAKKEIKIKNSSVVISPIKKAKVESMTPQMIEQQTRNLAKKEICIKNSSVDISPIKKVSAAKQVASPKKKASNLPLPKLTIPKKVVAVQKENLPGTPQPTDPGNLLKRNLKRKVDVRMDKKIDEIPKNSSPYTLVVSETENGSPVEQFVKMNSKPSKENVTGTPAPALKKSQKRILQPLDNNMEGNACPLRRKSPRLLATPKKTDTCNQQYKPG